MTGNPEYAIRNRIKWPEFREMALIAAVGTMTDSLVTSWIFFTYGFRAEIAEGNPIVKMLVPGLGYFAPWAHAPLEFAQSLAAIVCLLYLEGWTRKKYPKRKAFAAEIYGMALVISVGPFIGALSWLGFH